MLCDLVVLWSCLGLCSSLDCGGLECFPFKFRLDGLDWFSSSLCLDGPKCFSYEFSCLDGLEFVLVFLSVFHFHFVSFGPLIYFLVSFIVPCPWF